MRPPGMALAWWRGRGTKGLRVRVLYSVVALLVLANIASMLIERHVLLERIDAEVEESLAQEVEEVRSLATGRDPSTGQPFGDDVTAIFDTFLRRNIPAEGEALLTFVAGQPYKATSSARILLAEEPALVARWARAARPERGEAPTAAGPVRWHVAPLPMEGDPRGVFVVANLPAQERAEVDFVVRVEAAVSLIVLLGASALAWVLAGRSLRPVRQLTDTAQSITETDLARRIPVEGDDELAHLTTTFNDMLDRLEQAFVSQRAFLDDAAHELRTPITVIRGHLELMGDEPQERAETVELVMDELGRMTRMVDDLLLLATAERPGFLEFQPVDLTTFTTELHAKARGMAPRDWKLEHVAVGPVLSDHQRLTQAIMNLVRNAAQHTADGAVIAIGSEANGDEVRLWVRDTGKGIDPADHDRIFERFACAAGDRHPDGAGLGLAITRAIVKAHGGRIEVDSRPGAGATFTVRLPSGSHRRTTDHASH